MAYEPYRGMLHVSVSAHLIHVVDRRCNAHLVTLRSGRGDATRGRKGKWLGLGMKYAGCTTA